MQDRYVGDIGDFANNGLLRALFGKPGEECIGLKLGIVWCRNEGDPGSRDGNRIDYLNISDSNDSLYRKCDEKLYEELQKLVGKSLVSRTKRKIDQIKWKPILPDGTQHYDAPVPIGERNDWLKGALEKTVTSDVIFFNPDKGMALNIKKVVSHRRVVGLVQTTESPEHISISDLDGFAKRGQSLVIYQHNPRAREWIADIAKKLKKGLSTKHHPRVWALRWRGIQSRAYFIVAQTEKHKAKIDERLEPFKSKNTPWVKNGLFVLEVHI